MRRREKINSSDAAKEKLDPLASYKSLLRLN
jgi:hypothetical protein